jgi:ABC-type transport system involved in multi-copper enzyme maturation permease subunit
MHWRWPNFGLPLLSKELAEMAQLRRTYAVRVAFAVLIYLAAALLFLPAYWAYENSAKELFGRGANVLDVVYAIEWAGLVLFVPAIVSGALTAEKERNTLQLLLLTKLGPWTIVFEKLLSRLVPVATFLLVSLPLLFIAYLLGGLSPTDLGMAAAELVLMAFMLASIALFCSAYCTTSASAFILAYVATACVFLTPFLAIPFILIEDWFSVRIGAGHPPLFLWLNSPENLPARAALLTSTMGINLEWVFEGRGAGASVVRPFHTTPECYVVISVAGALFLLLARNALVRRLVPQPQHRARRTFAWLDARFRRLNDRFAGGVLILSPASDLPDADPVIWREKRRGNLGRMNYLIRVLLILELPLCAASGLSVAMGGDQQFARLGTISLLLWPIALLLIIVRASGLIAAEKARQTLDVLLATPLSIAELAGSKLRGLGRMKLIVAIPIVFQTLLIAFLRLAVGQLDDQWIAFPYRPDGRQVLRTWGDGLFFLFVTGLTIAVLFSLAAQLGFYFGLRAKTQGRAAIGALSVFVAFSFGPLIVRHVSDADWARNLIYASPIGGILVNEFPQLGARVDWTWTGQGTYGGPELGWQFHPLVHCALFAVIAGMLAVMNRVLAAQILLRPANGAAMSATFHDLQQPEYPLNGTCLADGAAVRQLFTALRRREPFMFELCGSNGSRLLIGLATERAVVQFSSADGEPPYLMAIDEKGTAKDGFIEFLVGGTLTPIARRFGLPVETATMIAIEFVCDGTQSNLVEWEEI